MLKNVSLGTCLVMDLACPLPNHIRNKSRNQKLGMGGIGSLTHLWPWPSS